jgi:conjugative transfer signal peptidase TraF
MAGARIMADRRRIMVAATGGVAVALGVTIVAPPSPRLMWNASASTPIGLYRIARGAPGVGDWVAVRTPIAVRRLAAERHYLPANVPLVKRVAARQGQRVCAAGRQVEVDGKAVASRRGRDPLGRPLPWWRGCQRLAAGELLVLGTAPDSFDGRYFGPISSSAVIGRAVPLWTW